MEIHLPLLEKWESHKMSIFPDNASYHLATVHLAGNTWLIKMLSQLVQTLGLFSHEVS